MRETGVGEYRVFTDGACSGNPGRGGWAAIVVDPSGARHSYAHAYSQTTNNRMELRAVIEAVLHTPNGSRVNVISDSQYVVHAVEKGWIRSWVQKGWRNSQKKPVANTDLWKDLLNAMADRTVTFSWIRGHEGHPENEQCDRMAVEAYTKGPWSQDSGWIGSMDGSQLRI